MSANVARMLALRRRHVADQSVVIPDLSDEEQYQLTRAAEQAALASLEQAVDNKGSLKLAMLKLQHLSLMGNRLSGQLPKTFANLRGLQKVYLNNNKLTGPLPDEWAALKQLRVSVLRCLHSPMLCVRYALFVFLDLSLRTDPCKRVIIICITIYSLNTY